MIYKMLLIYICCVFVGLGNKLEMYIENAVTCHTQEV